MTKEKPTVTVTILKAIQMVSSKFKVADFFQFYLFVEPRARENTRVSAIKEKA